MYKAFMEAKKTLRTAWKGIDQLVVNVEEEMRVSPMSPQAKAKKEKKARQKAAKLAAAADGTGSPASLKSLGSKSGKKKKKRKVAVAAPRTILVLVLQGLIQSDLIENDHTETVRNGPPSRYKMLMMTLRRSISDPPPYPQCRCLCQAPFHHHSLTSFEAPTVSS
jgi:hypothetical protein